MTLAPGDKVAFGEGEVLWADDKHVLVKWSHEPRPSVEDAHMIRFLYPPPDLALPPTDTDEEDDGTAIWTEALRAGEAAPTEAAEPAPGWRERMGLR